ncbi:MAG: exo-alpha-sialidase [Bacteroidetes bacterium]|nr:exo-alpha-sialidase [Bacteroidota bacterium]
MRNILLYLIPLLIGSPQLHLLAQIDDITRLPVQNLAQSVKESVPVWLSDNEIIIFYVSPERDSIYSTKSNNIGLNWEEPKEVQTVQIEDQNQELLYLSVLKTNTGRLILSWSVLKDGMYLVHSDDDGSTWSVPQRILGGGTNDLTRQNSEHLNLSQLNDGRILLCFNKGAFLNQLYYKESSDDGTTWSEEAIEFPGFELSGMTEQDLSIISLNNSDLLAIFQARLNNVSGIFKQISIDNGTTWSDTIRILTIGNFDKPVPKIVKRGDGSLLLACVKEVPTQISNFNQKDIYYIVSTDGGEIWQEEKRFTKYVGHDEYLNISHYNGKTFVSFATQRFTNKFQISYGIFEESIESFTPPYVISSNYSPTIIELDSQEFTFQATIIDNNLIENVYVTFADSLVAGELFDDGMHNDEEPNDNIFANTFPLPKSSNSISQVMTVNNIILPYNNNGILADVEAMHSFSAKIQSIDIDGNAGKYFTNIQLNYSIHGGEYEESGFLFSGGFFLSGYTNGELWANAMASASLITNYLPGRVNDDPDNPRNLVYVINSTDTPFGIRWQQWKDAVQLGADFYDGDKNGIYSPVDKNWNGIWDPTEDMPDLLGDQTAWCVFNDGQPGDERLRFAGVDPQGIEIQQTLFASSLPELENVIFIRYRIINRGTVSEILDSVYFALWSDPDLGVFSDDLVGSDTTLSSAFCYNENGDQFYGENPPAFFTTLLQGPVKLTSNPNDLGYDRKGPQIGSEEFPGYENQSITSFIHYRSSDPLLGDPNDEIQARYYMLGLNKAGNHMNPCDDPWGRVLGGVDCGEVNPLFWYSGDPVEEIGWLMNLNADQRSMLSTGPFKLEKDKPITIIGAYVMGRGTDAINSITVARANVQRAIEEYNNNFSSLAYEPGEPSFIVTDYILYQNYPNPFNPVTTIRYEIPEDGMVTIKIYDILGQEVKTVLNEFKQATRYEVDFNASGLASGVYIYRMQVNDFITSKKMILIK